MRNFPSDRTNSIYDAVNEGRHFVPRETEYKPTSKRGKVFLIVAGILLALFMILTSIQVIPALIS